MLKKLVLIITVILFQFLLTGAASAAETYYTVRSGDSLWKIAQQYGTSVEQLKQLNQLGSDNIQIGLTLIVKNTPDQYSTPEEAAVQNEEAAETTELENFYIVQSGDSLNSIARTYGTSVAMLKRINDLSTDVLNPGYELKVAITSDVSRGGNIIRTGAEILNTAGLYLGTPYVYGGSAPGGFDCSGFTKYVFSAHGYHLDRTAAAQYKQGTPVSKEDLQLGDLVFFKCSSSHIDHVGIYAGNNEFIHSSSPRSGGVIFTNLDESYYLRSYAGAVRIIK